MIKAGATEANRTPREPLSIRVVSPSTTCPTRGHYLAPQTREPLLEHVRDVWTLRYIETNCTAAIWRNDFGLKLRVEHGRELIESCLLRYEKRFAYRRTIEDESDSGRVVESPNN